jgi:hypothetical protein
LESSVLWGFSPNLLGCFCWEVLLEMNPVSVPSV